MNSIIQKNQKVCHLLIETNYYISVVAMVVSLIFVLAGKINILKFDGFMYGAIGNNLNVVIMYMILLSVLLPAYCFAKKKYQEITCLGGFYLLMPASLEIYSQINDIPLIGDYTLLFTYAGLSHISYSLIACKGLKQT